MLDKSGCGCVSPLKKVQVAQVGENSKLIRSSCCMNGALPVAPRQARVAMYNPPTRLEAQALGWPFFLQPGSPPGTRAGSLLLPWAAEHAPRRGWWPPWLCRFSPRPIMKASVAIKHCQSPVCVFSSPRPLCHPPDACSHYLKSWSLSLTFWGRKICSLAFSLPVSGHKVVQQNVQHL